MDVNRRTILGGAAAFASTAALPAAEAATRKVGGSKADATALKALGAYVDQHRAEWGIPGLTLAVVTRDGFDGFVASGWADVDKRIPVGAEHLFQIGSISKMMTALAAWSLIDEGELSPDVRLSDALKGLSVRGGSGITLQHLLNHTSGLPADSEIFPEGGLAAGFAPGAHMSYSNSGYQLAGKIAAHAHGGLFQHCVEARVLAPLGMTQSVGAIRVADRARHAQGYEPALTDRLAPRPGPMTASPWVDTDNAAGCITATAGDMARFMRFLLGLSEGKGGPVFSDETAKRFLESPVNAPNWGLGATYGNGIARVQIDGRAYLHHTGGMVSFCSALHLDRDAGIAAFASGNVHYSLNYRPRDITTFACKLFHALRTNAPLPAPKPAKATLEKPERFAGVYTAASGDAFEIVAGADFIRMRRDGRESVMQLAAETLFSSADPDFALTGVAFDLDGEKASRAWAGAIEFARNPAGGYRPPASPDLRALAGIYDSDDRWAGPITIHARDGRLWVGNAEALTPLAGGEWRLGNDDWSPERIRFDGVINGRPHRLLFSGSPYVRRFS
ncbi:MAG: serine hydrolase domain-containing protein [Parvularculaceae bacterium]